MATNFLCISCSTATACKHVFTCDEYKVIWCSRHLSKRGRNNWFSWLQVTSAGTCSEKLRSECPQSRTHFSFFPVTYEVADRRRCFCEDSVQDLLKNITSDGLMNLKWERKINKNQNLHKFKIFIYIRAQALWSTKQIQSWNVSWDWLPEVLFQLNSHRPIQISSQSHQNQHIRDTESTLGT